MAEELSTWVLIKGRVVILLTGATGYLGSALFKHFDDNRFPVRILARKSEGLSKFVAVHPRAEIFYSVDEGLFAGVTCVVHAAGRAHIFNEKNVSPLDEFRRVNVELTRKVAAAAFANGVKRFIYISSIGVNGSRNHGNAFKADDLVFPDTPYAISKWEAEIELQKIAASSDCELVIIRPPMIYGRGAPGNFGRLVQAARFGLPLPFGQLKNSRSFISIFNMCDLVMQCVIHPNVGSRVLLAADGDDVSTLEFFKLISASLGKPSRIFSVPQAFLEFCLTIVGKKELVSSLCGSLKIDITETIHFLQWRPSESISCGLKRALHDNHNI